MLIAHYRIIELQIVLLARCRKCRVELLFLTQLSDGGVSCPLCGKQLTTSKMWHRGPFSAAKAATNGDREREVATKERVDLVIQSDSCDFCGRESVDTDIYTPLRIGQTHFAVCARCYDRVGSNIVNVRKSVPIFLLKGLTDI